MTDSTNQPLTPLSPEARAVIARVVDDAPPLSEAQITELRILLGVDE